jgi:hypothetical protein
MYIRHLIPLLILAVTLALSSVSSASSTTQSTVAYPATVQQTFHSAGNNYDGGGGESDASSQPDCKADFRGDSPLCVLVDIGLLGFFPCSMTIVAFFMTWALWVANWLAVRSPSRHI